MSPRRAASESLVGGIVQLVFMNRAGFSRIEATPQAFLASLAPLIAFVLVGSGMEVAVAGWHAGAGDALQTLCVVLGQPVVSHFYARRFGREDRWLRYATAMNWCQLALPVAGGVLMVFLMLSGAAASPVQVVAGVVGLVFLYALLLNLFLIWRGLDLGFGRSVLFLVAVTLTLAVLLSVPVALRIPALTHQAVPGIAA
jgi:hypothetical protein